MCVCGDCQAVLSYRMHLGKGNIVLGSVLMPPVAAAFSVFSESNFLLFFLHVCCMQICVCACVLMLVPCLHVCVCEPKIDECLP